LTSTSLVAGIEIVRKALRIPCHTIAANAGVDAQEVVTRVTQEQQDVGYDALHGDFVDMMKAGIIDPTKASIAFCRINLGSRAALQTRLVYFQARHCVATKPCWYWSMFVMFLQELIRR